MRTEVYDDVMEADEVVKAGVEMVMETDFIGCQLSTRYLYV